MNRNTLLAAAVLSPALAATGASGSIVLDTFDAIPGDDAGGPRTIDSQIVNDRFGVGEVDAFVDLGAEAFFYNSDPGISGIASIIWDNQGGELNLDAATLQIDGFEFDFETVDQDFRFQFYLTSNGISGSAFAWVDVSASRAPQTVSVSLTDLSPTTNFDPTDVDEVRVFFGDTRTSVESLDFVLSEFRATVVPAPSSLALLGAAGLATRRRR